MKKTVIQDKDLPVYSRRTWLAMIQLILFSGLGYAGWRWLRNQPPDGGLLGGIPGPLRKGLEANEKLFTRYYDQQRLVKEYPKSKAAPEVRVNGNIGQDISFATESSWSLQVQKIKGENLNLSLAEIKRLPKTEIIFNFKCIEGWSQISWWGGVRLSDFITAFSLQQESAYKYIGMSTPDTEYSVGIDMLSAMHPQTILAYEMNGKPLLPEHGAPLRLIIPVKYGYKSLKQIGSIYFDNTKPFDYWAVRGYDYYAGL
jgi:DMSO/TMAO reductase YedYZ molybdopterin-dependent catalytic subunit